MSKLVRGLVYGCLLSCATTGLAADRPLAEQYLHAGRLAEGETSLQDRLKAEPADDEARFGLGTVQFIRGVERLGQSLYRYGAAPQLGTMLEVPFLRLPVPNNPNPEQITYEKLRSVFRDLLADLKLSEQTLAAIKSDDVKLTLSVGKIRLDLNSDGKADDEFSTILSRYLRRQNPAKLAGLEIAFDRGDVDWLRGYCHLLSALLEINLAHDGQELFAFAAPYFFARTETTIAPELRPALNNDRGFDFDLLFDAIAVVHLIHLPVIEPERMLAAREHLLRVFELSRQSWKFILAENDNDREWIPNPRQVGALGIPIRQDQIDAWLGFVDEGRALLEGTRLVPFWRGTRARGINLKRVFTEPRTFDLVLWVQGSGAVPYIEEGPQTNQAVWNNLQRVFGGDLFTFGVWFN